MLGQHHEMDWPIWLSFQCRVLREVKRGQRPRGFRVWGFDLQHRWKEGGLGVMYNKKMAQDFFVRIDHKTSKGSNAETEKYLRCIKHHREASK